MPELPEVEVVRRGLASAALGQRIVSAEVLRTRATRKNLGGAQEFCADVVGQKIEAIARRGKFLWCDLGANALAIHLGMSGQILVDRGEVAGIDPRELSIHTRAVLGLENGDRLRFVDQRTFGYLASLPMVPTADGLPGGMGSERAVLPANAVEIARDPLDENIDLRAVARVIKGRRIYLKRALLNQNLISGIGNIYADEALHAASVHGGRYTDDLSVPRIIEVVHAAQAVMRRALDAGGTSFDALYVNTAGEPGYFARSLAVYGRAGAPCPRCGGPVIRDSFMERSSYICRRCQSRPRYLPPLSAPRSIRG